MMRKGGPDVVGVEKEIIWFIIGYACGVKSLYANWMFLYVRKQAVGISFIVGFVTLALAYIFYLTRATLPYIKMKTLVFTTNKTIRE